MKNWTLNAALSVVSVNAQVESDYTQTWDSFNAVGTCPAHCDSTSETDVPGPGKGNSKTGTNANYLRLNVEGNEVFSCAVRHLDCNLFEAMMGMTMKELKDPFGLFQKELAHAMNASQ